MGGWLDGWLENWRVIPISAFNYVIVEVLAEIGNNNIYLYIVISHTTSYLVIGI